MSWSCYFPWRVGQVTSLGELAGSPPMMSCLCYLPWWVGRMTSLDELVMWLLLMSWSCHLPWWIVIVTSFGELVILLALLNVVLPPLVSWLSYFPFDSCVFCVHFPKHPQSVLFQIILVNGTSCFHSNRSFPLRTLTPRRTWASFTARCSPRLSWACAKSKRWVSMSTWPTSRARSTDTLPASPTLKSSSSPSARKAKSSVIRAGSGWRWWGMEGGWKGWVYVFNCGMEMWGGGGERGRGEKDGCVRLTVVWKCVAGRGMEGGVKRMGVCV